MGREVTFNFPPRRVVSLVPSLTEMLCDLGVELVGRTRFCIHPTEQVKKLPSVGGTKDFKVDRIVDLRPDLVIGNKEENYREGIEALEQHVPVWMTDINTISDSLQVWTDFGEITNTTQEAKKIRSSVEQKLASLKSTKTGEVLYLIWYKPWMAAGSQTYIDEFLSHLGYSNVITDSRYPELTLEQMRDLSPEKILLSSEPFPFKAKHQRELELLFPESKVELVDGEAYSWYGSRLLKVGI
ncbi:substrate-binding family protein [Marinoscillum furvescens DSM 4134]|uniref:Substrate-binding family protein n=2 Tax=Marinoscillum furvescens TaxID=1026 RepID=A0A3D9L466_MARFU|nr:substrate-binding family protein [Marinoscillum furvescens DSM 4134]